jgi:uncharacterized protein (TIGR00661 family)
VKRLITFPEIRWQIFSKHTKSAYHIGRISVFPAGGKNFVESIVSAKGVICGAGFETPAEVLHMNKKLLVVPMIGQYEQQCNAAALKRLNVPVVKKLTRKSLKKIHTWLENDQHPSVSFPYNAEEVVQRVFEIYKIRK